MAGPRKKKKRRQGGQRKPRPRLGEKALEKAYRQNLVFGLRMKRLSCEGIQKMLREKGFNVSRETVLGDLNELKKSVKPGTGKRLKGRSSKKRPYLVKSDAGAKRLFKKARTTHQRIETLKTERERARRQGKEGKAEDLADRIAVKEEEYRKMVRAWGAYAKKKGGI